MVESTTTDPLGATRRRLVASQAAFFALLALCIVIDHSAQAQRNGISFYGVDHETIGVIAAAYVVISWGMWGMAGAVGAAGAPAGLAQAVKAVALFPYVILVTPYTAGTLMNWTHMTAGVIMALIQMAIALGLLSRDRGAAPGLAFAVQLAGGILAALSLQNWHFGYLLQGEVTFQIGFAAVALQWLRALAPLAEARAQSPERTIE